MKKHLDDPGSAVKVNAQPKVDAVKTVRVDELRALTHGAAGR